jgi:2-(1,2-epoxy-1,2-dihydrophenyl)acetyl-CoA isomerase
MTHPPSQPAPAGPSMSTAAHVASRMYTALQDRDLEQLISALHPEVRMVVAAGMPLDLGGTHEGRDAVLRMWQRLSMSFDVAPRPHHVDELRPAAVCVRGTYEGRHREGGTRFDAAFVHIIEVTDAQVSGLEQVTDTHQWHRALPHPSS